MTVLARVPNLYQGWRPRFGSRSVAAWPTWETADRPLGRGSRPEGCGLCQYSYLTGPVRHTKQAKRRSMGECEEKSRADSHLRLHPHPAPAPLHNLFTDG